LGIKMGVAAVYAKASQAKAIGIGGRINHCVLYYDSALYSPYTGLEITDYEASYYFTFEEVFAK
jgi:hypothetical protein